MSLLEKFENLEKAKTPTPVTKKPPKPPKPAKEEPIKSSTIDFNKIANKSYFQRFIQELFKDIIPEQFKGVDFRVSKEKAVEIFDEKIGEIRRGHLEHSN